MTSPPEPSEALSGRLVYWLPVIGAPLGIGAAIFASFGVAGWHVTHSAVVQVEPQWVAGERLAARVQVLDAGQQAVPGAEVTLELRRGEQRAPLGTLRDASGVGAAQGRLEAPPWPPGPATLALTIAAHERFDELVEVELVAKRPPRRGVHTVSASTKNWADDTDPQPERLRIALRPLGRFVAGFENSLVARVTDLEGRPHRGPVEIRLLDGEFGPHRSSSGAPALVARAAPDAAGLVKIGGLLASDVARFEVRAFAPEAPEAAKDGAPKEPAAKDPRPADAAKKDAKSAAATRPHAAKDAAKDAKKPADAAKDAKPADAAKKDKQPAAPAAKGDEATPGAAPAEPAPLGVRKFRFVSFAGAVAIEATPQTLAAGDPVAIKARALRPKRPVFVDIHAPDGAWIDTLDPPVVGAEPPRPWATAGLGTGLLQVEAYHFANAPGESAGLARLVLGTGGPPPLADLLALQRERLDMPRVEKEFDKALEEKYFTALAAATLDADAEAVARAWLVGTLPVEVLGPPMVLTTRSREEEAVTAGRRLWAGRIRLLLLGGGGLFLVVTTLLIVISHRRAAERLARESHGQGPEMVAEVRRAQRAVLLRAVGLVVTMGLGLVLTAAVLDKLFWQT